ncbi:NHLM bacteriocin system secretion protein [Desulfosporosinus orientis DSM 765]|uniref:NHLM bacteriocin system secretion protein n=1 Tax=Desulfosporosinus orientis (strain ATCC 19365 / DSM 765 / NCIMB 8382 / VKM B-1628 / Singapore I) TaxID=768706 RepID=G7W9A7_DESOD|nr:NHLP bacteriocin system secretion protein [Desulfosporosinus orientis]AET69244.1 NHLM bacteriocin system secretion protein [Desulfosporosinus orientis DSM 765]
MEQKIFREVSLKRLSSPEQLDQLIKVTSPRGWLALVALSLLLAGAIVWSFVGSIPTKIAGQGILLNDAGVFSLTHDTSGRVLDLRFAAGDKVKKGDVIARIEQPELVKEINDLLDNLQDLDENGQTDSPKYQILEKQVEQLRQELYYRSQIVSPIEGRVLELNMHPGNIVQPGQTLATLEQYGAAVRLEAVLYVSAELAGKIRPGMEVQISPTIVNKEEYGYMLGRVISVAEYPATVQSMMQTLGNENLVSLLTGQGAPLEVQADLVPDNSTVSGYRWSSPAGPPLAMTGGTLVQGDVVIAREKPVAKVIPFYGAQTGASGQK